MTAVAGDYGIATSGECGTAITGDWGHSITLDGGTSIAGSCGSSESGNYGSSEVGCGGKAGSGYDGFVSIKYWDADTNEFKFKKSGVGIGGLNPFVFYRLDENNEFVPVEE